ncbi:hypothetical protein EJ06DRAFT_581494 [Trichodelitschia bisporula]|uniref:Casein kinase II beta 2 subunit n=1 Tax=Trichodelitschia bisporula TaxID=703511 RepID=A0A6G1HZ73_9PEZI|nr:hypothetical protein EJ06DRAFT_581494 [Trichodelitschia bisporula]
MASAGSFHILVAKNAKIIRLAVQKASRIIQNQLPAPYVRQAPELQPLFARVAPRQPIHPAAFLRQSKRWFSGNGFTSAIRRFSSSPGGASGLRYDRSSFPTSRVASAIGKSTGRAPFASTLRPNLTGGTLGRTAGGYTLGSGRIGGARYFSHTPGAPAQVINTVSQAVRAFFVGGQKAHFDGVYPCTGHAKYKVVTPLQDEAMKKMASVPKLSPGSFIDFSVNPTITALTPLSNIVGFPNMPQKVDTLNTGGLLDILSVDFARALKDLAMVLNDLKQLAAVGDFPITYRDGRLRVHFPGCDAETVERLANELGIQRGVVGQDEDFDAFVGTEMALLFPFAPSKPMSECSFFESPSSQTGAFWQGDIPASPVLRNLATPALSSVSGGELGYQDLGQDNPWVSSPSGYSSFHSGELEDSGRVYQTPERRSTSEYEGIEGIYRFIAQCDAAAAATRN